MKGKLIIVFVSVFLVFVSLSAYSWDGETHRAITERVNKQSLYLDAYLKNIGFPDGQNTNFTLRQQSGYYTPAELGNVYILPFDREKTAREWFIDGSYLEDGLEYGGLPFSLRARHHFHDPEHFAV